MPSAAALRLVHRGKPLDLRLTVEAAGLYAIHRDVEVRIAGSDYDNDASSRAAAAASAEPPLTAMPPQEVAAAAARAAAAAAGAHSPVARPHAQGSAPSPRPPPTPTPAAAPSPPPGPSPGPAFQSGAPPPFGSPLNRSDSQASRYDALAQRLATIEAAYSAAVSLAAGAAEDGIEVLLDELATGGGRMDEVDRRGLQQSARGLRTRTRAAKEGAPGVSGGGALSYAALGAVSRVVRKTDRDKAKGGN